MKCQLKPRENLRRFFLSQSSLAYSLFKSPIQNDRVADIKIILGTCCTTANAIGKLGLGNLYINECYMLARSIFEKLVISAYLLYCDDDEYKAYKSFAFNKTVRKMSRSQTAGSKTISTSFDNETQVSSSPAYANAVRRFTSKKGKERKKWTDNSLNQMLTIISEKSSLKVELFLVAKLEIWENASEALHGSSYGLAFHTGVFDPEGPATSKRQRRNLDDERILSLYLFLGDLIGEVLKGVNEFSSIPEILDASSKNRKMAIEIGKQVSSVKNQGSPWKAEYIKK